MTDVLGDDTEFTELVDAHVPRVDLVGTPANGAPGFLLMKQDGQAGLMPPDAIRDLIGKTAQPEPAREDTVTMTGSPGALMKLIHEASVRREATVAKEKYDTADRKHMGATGAAMPDGSYPIEDRADLERAIHAVGRGGGSHDAIRRHIAARAKALGASSEIPDNWNADGSLKGDVAKEMDMDDALDATTALAEPDMDAPGMPTDPGSPAWEAIDAATACKWTAILARARNAIDLLAEREMLEAASADPDDAENAWDLQDACCAIDYAISVLAPFAVAEQAEAECGDDMQMVGKALDGFDAAPLDTIEALGHVAKAGRVLSSANEAAIRGAVESLQKVLASLPAAPVEKESGPVVAKTANEEGDMPQPTPSSDATAASGQEPAMGTQQPEPKPEAGVPVTEVGKADGDGKAEVVVVYDQKGRLVGIVDPEDITPVANAEAEPDEMDNADGDDGDPGAENDADKTTDLTPQPPAEAGTPADAAPSDEDGDGDVTKSDNTETNNTLSEMLKSSLLAAVEDVVAKNSAAQGEEIAQLRDALLEMADLTKAQQDRIRALEEQPAEPRVFSNGAVPPSAAPVLRGHDRGAAPVDVTKAREMKQAMYQAADAREQNRIANEMQTGAIEALQAIHRR